MAELARTWTLTRSPTPGPWTTLRDTLVQGLWLGGQCALGYWALRGLFQLHGPLRIRTMQLEELAELDPSWMDPARAAPLLPVLPILATLALVGLASMLLDRFLLRRTPGLRLGTQHQDWMAGKIRDGSAELDAALEPGERLVGGIEEARLGGWAATGVFGSFGPAVLFVLLVLVGSVWHPGHDALPVAFAHLLVGALAAWAWFTDPDGALPALLVGAGLGMVAILAGVACFEPKGASLALFATLAWVGLLTAAYSRLFRFHNHPDLLVVTTRGLRRIRLGRAGIESVGPLAVPVGLRREPGRGTSRWIFALPGGGALGFEARSDADATLETLLARAGLDIPRAGEGGAASLRADLPALAGALAATALVWTGVLAVAEASIDRAELVVGLVRNHVCRTPKAEAGGRTDRDTDLIERAARLHPDSLGIRLLLAEDRLIRGRVRDAARILAELQATRPNWVQRDAWRYGWDMQGLVDQGSAAETVLAREPSPWDPVGPGREPFAAGLALWLGRGQGYAESWTTDRDRTAILAHFDRAIALEPAAPGPRLAAALALALPLPDRGECEAAIPDPERSARIRAYLAPLRSHPDFGRVARLLSGARFESSNRDETRAVALLTQGEAIPAELARELSRVRLVARDEVTQPRGLLGPVRDGADLERLFPELSTARPGED